MLRLVVFVTIICSAYGSVLDPCRLLKCNKPDVPCLELIPNSESIKRAIFCFLFIYSNLFAQKLKNLLKLVVTDASVQKHAT